MGSKHQQIYWQAIFQWRWGPTPSAF
jgi:hypothetical protein